MVTKEDFEHLIEHFEIVKVPENLEKFVEKIKIMYEEILVREEAQKKLAELNQKLEEII